MQFNVANVDKFCEPFALFVLKGRDGCTIGSTTLLEYDEVNGLTVEYICVPCTTIYLYWRIFTCIPVLVYRILVL
jgi:hypothetical protein